MAGAAGIVAGRRSPPARRSSRRWSRSPGRSASWRATIPRVRQLEGLEQKVEVLHGSVPETHRNHRERHPVRRRPLARPEDRTVSRSAREPRRRGALRERPAARRLQLQRRVRAHAGVALRRGGGARHLGRRGRRASREMHRRTACSNVTAREANVFDELRHFERSGERFDTIVLDPPAFAKNKASVPNAVAGYKDINLRALRILRPGGTLVTCSCSYNVDETLFYRHPARGRRGRARGGIRGREAHAGPRSSGADGRAGNVLLEVRDSQEAGVTGSGWRRRMGQDVHCIATWNGRRSVGTASLETDDIIFRGEFRLRIPFKTITRPDVGRRAAHGEDRRGHRHLQPGDARAAVGGAHPEPEGRPRQTGHQARDARVRAGRERPVVSRRARRRGSTICASGRLRAAAT